jgi:DNA (cytosine-5)-methyltransferase 1
VGGHSPIGREHLQPGDYKTDIADACEAQGLPRDFTDHMPFTMHGKRSVIGNGVPMAMGRAVADAVLRAVTP